MLSSATRLVDAGRVAERLADRLVEPAKILIIIGIAYTLATAGWYLVSGPTPATLTDAKPTRHATRESRLSASPTSLRAICSARPTPTAARRPCSTRRKPDLRLTSKVCFRRRFRKSRRRSSRNRANPVSCILVGGKMPGNATLTEVHADRIVLRRGSAFETLALQRRAVDVDRQFVTTRNRRIAASDNPVRDVYRTGRRTAARRERRKPASNSRQLEFATRAPNTSSVGTCRAELSGTSAAGSRRHAELARRSAGVGVGCAGLSTSTISRVLRISRRPVCRRVTWYCRSTGDPVGDMQQDQASRSITSWLRARRASKYSAVPVDSSSPPH